MKLAPVVRGKAAREAIASPDRLRVQAEIAEAHGDIVRLEQGPFVVHLLRGPAEVRQVLVERAASFRKGRAMDLLASQLGKGLIVADGEDWLVRRRRWKPILRPRHVAAFARPLEESIHRLLLEWQAAAVRREMVVLLDEARRFTWDVTSEQILGTRSGHELRGPLLEVLQSAHLTQERTPEFRAKLRFVDDALDAVIERRRASDSPPDDMLGALLADGEPLSAAELRGELRNMFLGSYDTTANALAWSWIELAREPAAAGATARGVVMETLRLFPPVYNFGREAIEEVEVGGFAVPRGSYVLVSPYLVHRHPAHWTSPAAFDPRRFEGRAGEGRHPMAYLPFGAGPRGCVGEDLATKILVEALNAVSSRFTLALEPRPEAIEPELNVTLTPPRVGARLESKADRET